MPPSLRENHVPCTHHLFGLLLKNASEYGDTGPGRLQQRLHQEGEGPRSGSEAGRCPSFLLARLPSSFLSLSFPPFFCSLLCLFSLFLLSSFFFNCTLDCPLVPYSLGGEGMTRALGASPVLTKSSCQCDAHPGADKTQSTPCNNTAADLGQAPRSLDGHLPPTAGRPD